MMEIILTMAITTAVVTLGAMACAGINPMVFLRKTFAPLTYREFWFPPCPFCWGARVAAAGLVLVVGIHIT